MQFLWSTYRHSLREQLALAPFLQREAVDGVRVGQTVRCDARVDGEAEAEALVQGLWRDVVRRHVDPV